jgi:hypothetical protein
MLTKYRIQRGARANWNKRREKMRMDTYKYSRIDNVLEVIQI